PTGGAGDRRRVRVGEGRQLAAVERDGAADLEVDGIRTGVGIRLGDGPAQRAGAAVVEQAGDAERRRDQPVFQRLDGGAAAGRGLDRAGDGAGEQLAEPGTKGHRNLLPERVSLRYNGSSGPGRADRAPGRCRAGEGVAWRHNLTGRFVFWAYSARRP